MKTHGKQLNQSKAIKCIVVGPAAFSFHGTKQLACLERLAVQGQKWNAVPKAR